MFKVLTGEKKRRAISPATIAASIAVHLLLLGGLAFASTGDTAPKEEVGGIVELPPLPTEPKEPPPPPPVQPEAPQPADEQPTTPPVPGEVLQVEQVTDVPTEIKPEEPGAQPVNPIEYDGDGKLGTYIGTPVGPPTGPVGPPTPPPPAPDWIMPAELADEQPVLDRNGLGRALERHYPSLLRDNRVSGRVLIKMVVDENGVPVPGSAQVIEASHPAFGQASLRAAERFRFRPAKLAGTRIPVEVTIPIVWTAQ